MTHSHSFHSCSRFIVFLIKYSFDKYIVMRIKYKQYRFYFGILFFTELLGLALCCDLDSIDEFSGTYKFCGLVCHLFWNMREKLQHSFHLVLANRKSRKSICICSKQSSNIHPPPINDLVALPLVCTCFLWVSIAINLLRFS